MRLPQLQNFQGRSPWRMRRQGPLLLRLLQTLPHPFPSSGRMDQQAMSCMPGIPLPVRNDGGHLAVVQDRSQVEACRPPATSFSRASTTGCWPSAPTPARRFSIWTLAPLRWDPRFHSRWMENSTSRLRAGLQVVAVAEPEPAQTLLPQDPQICLCLRSTERRHYRGPQLARSNSRNAVGASMTAQLSQASGANARS